MWESKIDINQVTEIRCRTTCFFGIGAITKMEEIAANLKKRDIKSVLIMTGRSAYKATGAWDYVEKALKNNGISYVLYDKVTPNPTTSSVDEAVALAKKESCGAVIGIGGGSPIDSAKSAAILLAYPEKTAKQLYSLEFAPEVAAPVIAINLTHGTGTEVNRFAVATITENNHKPAIAYDCIYPLYAIDDPALMVTLSPEQTRFVSIDAINHVTEAATSKCASAYSIMLAKETVRLVTRYLPQAISNPKDLTARYYLSYASLLAGISFDNGLLHFTHALEHPLSAIKPDLSHGLGLSMLLPAVVKYSYVAQPEVLAEVFEPIAPYLEGVPGEADTIAMAIEQWLASMGVPQKLLDEGFTEKDLDQLVELSFHTPSLDSLLSIAPIPATPEVVRAIYEESLTSYK